MTVGRRKVPIAARLDRIRDELARIHLALVASRSASARAAASRVYAAERELDIGSDFAHAIGKRSPRAHRRRA